MAKTRWSWNDKSSYEARHPTKTFGGVNPDVAKELVVPTRLSDAALRAAFVAATVQGSGLLIAAKRPAPMAIPAAKAPALIAQTGHIWTGGADDTAVKSIGDLSRKITTAGAGSPIYFDNSGLGSTQDWSKHNPRVRLRIDNVARLGQIALSLESGGANVMSVGVPQDILTSGDWHTITLPRSSFSVNAGSPVWTGITKVNANIRDNSTGAVTMNFHGVDLVPDLAAVAPNGIFVLECDDFYASQKSMVVPLAESLGVPITFAPIVERVTSGQGGFTVADMKALQRNGHAFIGHAFTGAFHASGGDAAAWLADFTAQQQWYDSIGLPWGSTHHAMCQGTGSFVAEGAQMDVLRARFRSVRNNGGYYQAIIPGDPHRLPTRLYGGDSLANLQSLVDKVSGVVGGGGAGVLNFSMHETVAGSTNGTASGTPAIAINNLKSLIQYAQGKGMLFMTRPQYMDLVGL